MSREGSETWGTLESVTPRVLFSRGEGDVGVYRRQQVAHSCLCLPVLAVSAAFVEPLLQVLSGGRRKLGEEESGAALIAGPDHVGVTVERDVGAGKHAAEMPGSNSWERVRWPAPPVRARRYQC